MPRTITVMERSELSIEDNKILDELLESEKIDITYEGSGNVLLSRAHSWWSTKTKTRSGIRYSNPVFLDEVIKIPAGVMFILI